MPNTITKQKLDELIEERIKAQTGCASLKEWKEKVAEVKKWQAGQDSVVRDQMESLMWESMPKSYAKKAARTIRQDTKWKGLGLQAARFVRAAILAKKQGCKGEDIALEWGDPWLGEFFEKQAEYRKALNTTTGAAGGFLVPPELADTIIELKRAKSVVRMMGATEFTIGGNFSMNRQSGPATATYTQEGVNILASQQTFDQLNFTLKKLTALTPISNDLLRQADPSADAIVRRDLTMIHGLREDIAFLRDDGTVSKPKGIRFATIAANVNDRTQAAPPSTIDEIIGDLFDMIELVEGGNAAMERPGWVMTSRTKSGIMRLRDGVGDFLFKDEMSAGNLLGWPFGISNQIPKNLGGGADETELYFGDWPSAMIGDQLALEIDVHPNAAYHNGTEVVSGVNRDETVIRSIALHDFQLRHDDDFTVLTAVDWGA